MYTFLKQIKKKVGQHGLDVMATCDDSSMKDRNASQCYVIHINYISVLGKTTSSSNLS
jgi:hypothetical protein